jgi:BirA family biotin operon repressor/biotin-[acetyl-CoA-carboxylase] ligase
MKSSYVNLIQVVRILNDGLYHDGDSMGATLNLTRSAIWKIIKKLTNYGIKIDSIKGKGYALLEPLVLLDINSINENLLDPVDLSLFEVIDSTNQYLKSFKAIKKPKICLTEMQTQGKGRFNREWYSPFARNLYLSCLYPFQKDVSELAGLSLLTSLAVVQTLRDLRIEEGLSVKWSNDIVYNNKKLSGNLIELQAETHAACQAIIGIGINVNMLSKTNDPISQPWISMQQIMNQYVNRNELCALLIMHLLTYLKEFDKSGFAPFVETWNRLDCLVNKPITLKNVNNHFVGRMLGVNDQGYLLLELSTGEVRAFSSGETTILKK